MNDWYFYQELGKTVGPVGVEEIRSRIREGQIRVFDLVFRDGEANWRMALEHGPLRGEFKTSTLASLKERPWICLQKKNPTGTDFVTTGPFTRDEIHESLLKGKIAYSDYAWKDSFSDWKRIGALEEFNPRVRHPSAPSVPATKSESPREILKNVVEVRKRTPPVPEPVPAEAIPVDLARTQVPLPPRPQVPSSPTVERQAAAPTLPKPRIEKLRASKSAPDLDLDRTEISERTARKRPLVDWGLVGVLVLVLAGVVLIVSRFAMPHSPFIAEVPVAEPPPAEVPAHPKISEKMRTAKVESAPEDDAEDEEKPHAVAHKKAPTELFLAVQNVGTNQARIEIRTDGSAEFPVYVQVVGPPGQMAEGGAFYKFMRFKPVGDLLKPLDLSDLKLVEGKFILRAETGDLKKETKFSLGTSDPQFKASVVRQRKLWAHAIWKERLTLFQLSVNLEKALRLAIVPTAKFSAKGLESINGVKRTAGANLLMFDDWWEMHEILTAAKEGPSVALLNRAVKERDRLGAFSVWK